MLSTRIKKRINKIVIGGSRDAKSILRELDEYTQDVEIVKGSMDDVFLNVTGKNISNTEEENDGDKT